MISLADLKTALRITTTRDDGYLAGLEAAAVAMVQRETGRFFGAQESVTEYIIGGDDDTLFLTDPCSSLPTTVKERSTIGGDPTTITASADDGYVLRGTMKLVRKAGNLWTYKYEYEVTYTRGYAANTEPAEIRQLVTQIVSEWYERRLVSSDGSLKKVPMSASAILAGWRRRPWG